MLYASDLTLIQVVAIIDIDCAVRNGFDEGDQKALQNLAKLLSSSCDW